MTKYIVGGLVLTFVVIPVVAFVAIGVYGLSKTSSPPMPPANW